MLHKPFKDYEFTQEYFIAQQMYPTNKEQARKHHKSIPPFLLRQAQTAQEQLAERSISSIFQPIALELFALASAKMGGD